MAASINIARIAFVLFVAVLSMTPSTSGLDSCASALQPIFSGAQGYRCVQLTLTTASASTSAVRIPLQYLTLISAPQLTLLASIMIRCRTRRATSTSTATTMAS